MSLQDTFKRNIRRKDSDILIGSLYLATPPSRRELAFIMERAIERAPQDQILQWKSRDNTRYMLKVSHKGSIPTWILSLTNQEPGFILWTTITKDPDQIYQLLLKKEPASQCGVITGEHQALPPSGPFISAGVNPGALFLDRYKIDELIAHGGMGRVYKAHDLTMDRPVAIKLLHPHLMDEMTSMKRFEQEMKACINFRHPNLVSVYDCGHSPDSIQYMVMEYVNGCTLEEYLRSAGPLSIGQFVGIFSHTLNALDYAHRNGIVHRDVKPKNLMLVPQQDGTVLTKLLDFGIAKVLPQLDTALQKLTQTGDALGSPYYMSPEQCQGWPLDARSDIYSLGCVMYEALAGMRPFDGQNALTTIILHINTQPVPLNALKLERSFPEDLEQIILQALEKDPNNRHPSALDFLAALQGFAAHRPDLAADRQISKNLVEPSQPEDTKEPLTVQDSAIEAGILALLKCAGLITEDDAQSALNFHDMTHSNTAQYLLDLGKIDYKTYRSATDCQSLIELCNLKLEDAAMALQYCLRRGLSLEEALSELT